MINKYRQLFTSLHVSNVKGFKAPHKAVLLLSILELVEYDLLAENRIVLSEDLMDAYSFIWQRYVGNSSVFRDSIYQPFWYMKSEPFWTLCLSNQSKVGMCDRKPSDAELKSNYYAELDPELYHLIHDVSARAALRVTLISKYLINQGDAALVEEIIAQRVSEANNYDK